MKAAEVGGESCFEAVAFVVGDRSMGLEASGLDKLGLVAGDTSVGVKFAGFEGLRLGVGDATVGKAVAEVGEATGVSEVEEVGDELQPASPISKVARNH